MNVYEVVTNNIISKLDKGIVPWHKPWSVPAPRNWKTGKLYSGVNILLLQGGEYLTFKQAIEAGGNVKKGEKGTPVVYFNWITKEDEQTKEEKRIPFLKYYTVFEIGQCENIQSKQPTFKPLEFNPIDAAENIVTNYKDKPEIRHTIPSAFYSPSRDYINMPQKERFDCVEEYYSTLFHEMVHSTAHTSRLNRKEGIGNKFKSKSYSKEELIAEIGAAMLCNIAHIDNETLDNSVAYIQGWKDALKADSRLIVLAAQQAQKAANYIQGIKEKECITC